MRVLIACEFSGIVRAAFIKQGHDAISCDLLPSEKPGPHYQGNVFDIIEGSWDLIIAFPPCTYLCSSGARWWAQQQEKQRDALRFISALLYCMPQKFCLENPIGILSTRYRKPNQIVQPWQFGHGETKATCLWLKGLPNLIPTNIVKGREARIHKMAPSKNRSKDRSRTFQGIADAMAEQWGTT